MSSVKIIDTNVAVVANGNTDHVDSLCQLSCIETLEDIISNEKIALDKQGFILGEYKKRLSFKGQPKLGDMFFKFAHDNQANSDKVVTADLREHDDRGFHEFPEDDDLKAFDADDRMFVALSLALEEPSEIINASDTDWRDFYKELTRSGIKIRFICPQHVSPE